jgi:hypothetical protein
MISMLPDKASPSLSVGVDGVAREGAPLPRLGRLGRHHVRPGQQRQVLGESHAG